MAYKTKIKLLLSSSLLLFLGGILILGGDSFAQSSSGVPNQYKANYNIEGDWNRLAEIFVNIDAESSLKNYGGSATYSEQHDIMERVFQYFPQDNYSFKLTYQKCLSTTKNMAENYSADNFQAYTEECKNPLSTLKTTLDSKYTVKVSANANPPAGSAPLTVTFDARGSMDPSNETIPENNYFWYYRDIDAVDKVIGIGPVVKHTFEEAGTYIVHCTVRSSNHGSGILDGTKNITVVVSPKSANISVYTNGKKMQKNKSTKIGIQEARKGVLFDGSSTTPIGGREIMTHYWNITSRDGFSWKKTGDGSPSYVNVPLPGQGEYMITLGVTDNERNNISETYSLAVSDPVAIIQQTPEKGTTSTSYTFSSNASYSLTSRLKLYTWEIYDSDGNKLDTLQGKSIQRQFKKPGNYSVKLTVEDEMGLNNTDIVNVYVESTPPNPQFTITPTNKRKYPSEFDFDASSSSDVDVSNSYDTLTYEWEFSNPNAAKVISTQENNKMITVVFNEKGTHTVTLRVSDSYGKATEISKDVKVESILRPELSVNPKAAVWDDDINFKVQTNVKVINYEWNFGDGSPSRSSVDKNVMTNKYNKIGTYTVKVKVTDENGDSNEVSEQVFIGEQDSPVAGYYITSHNVKIPIQAGACLVKDPNGTGEILVDAYPITRQEQFTINGGDSVNAQGNTTNLKYYYQEQGNAFEEGKNYSHKFNSIGCQLIRFQVEDTSLNKSTAPLDIRFKVVNALPTLTNLTLSYPQYGNEIGVGFQQADTTQDIFSSGVDPIIIKVTAEGASDPDGSVSYFKWYYYPKGNPNKLLETKVTPGTVPYAFFSVPRQPGEFVFGVKIFDNDDGYNSSDEILSNGPMIMFPPNTKQPDIPIVTLKSSVINANVGDVITFDVISKIISDRSDFEAERTIQLDFDGDGTIDYTTKDDRVEYAYEKASPTNAPYVPIAYVIYRDYRGMGEGAPIVIKTGLRPQIITTSVGKTVLFKDVSVGNIVEREICFDAEQCEKGNAKYISKSLDKVFKVIYPRSGNYRVTMKVKDLNGNEATSEWTINVTDTTTLQPLADDLFLISLPESNSDGGIPEIFVNKQLNNEIVFYVNGSLEKFSKCYIDTDVSYDSDGDEDASNDNDFICNKITTVPYTPSYESSVGRVFFQRVGSDILQYQDFLVSFAGYEKNLNEETSEYYTIANELVTGISDRTSFVNGNLRTLLVSLRNNLANGDKNAQRGDLILLQQFIEDNRNSIKISESQWEKLNDLINGLSDYATNLTGTPAEIAKGEILSLLPLGLRNTINNLFSMFENTEGDEETSVIEERAKLLNEINSTIYNSVAKGNSIGSEEIDASDYDNIVKKDLCTIADEYQIVQYTQVCNTYRNDDQYTKATENGTLTETFVPVEKVKNSNSSSGIPTFLKVLLRILGIMVLAFVGLISAFAIKAKLRENEENEEE